MVRASSSSRWAQRAGPSWWPSPSDPQLTGEAGRGHHDGLALGAHLEDDEARTIGAQGACHHGSVGWLLEGLAGGNVPGFLALDIDLDTTLGHVDEDVSRVDMALGFPIFIHIEADDVRLHALHALQR